jgi:antitoxin (DNA-binding transcriptional repressor) of toxin-antitoxin stability system
MPVYNVHEAKTQLSKLLERAAGGEEVVIARVGVAWRVWVPAPPPTGGRPLDAEKGCVFISDDFDAPLPDDVLDDFEASGSCSTRTLAVDARHAGAVLAPRARPGGLHEARAAALGRERLGDRDQVRAPERAPARRA